MAWNEIVIYCTCFLQRIALYFLIGSLDFSPFIISDKFLKRYLEGVATSSFTKCWNSFWNGIRIWFMYDLDDCTWKCLKLTSLKCLGQNMTDKTALEVAKIWNIWDMIRQQSFIYDHLITSLLKARQLTNHKLTNILCFDWLICLAHNLIHHASILCGFNDTWKQWNCNM